MVPAPGSGESGLPNRSLTALPITEHHENFVMLAVELGRERKADSEGKARVEGDAKGWLESSPIRDMLIEGKLFIACGIEIGSSVHDPKQEEPVHENIRIRNNTFDTFENNGIFVRAVKGLFIEGNQSGPYPLKVYVDPSCNDIRMERNDRWILIQIPQNNGTDAHGAFTDELFQSPTMKNILIILLSAVTVLRPLLAEVPNAPTETIALWPAGTPGIDPSIQEKVVPNPNVLIIDNIHNPTLTVSRPSAPNGCAIVVCPSGAYAVLSIINDGTKVAEWLASQGITAFVLKYRLPTTADVNYKDPVPLSDALRAVQWVRSHAKDYRVDGARIGIMGFSAGGHLAASAGTLFSRASEFGNDAVAHTSARPDFMALIYPVITNDKDFRHASLNSLLPSNATPGALDALSREKSVRADTPPAFLAHAKNDKTVPYQNSVLMHEALQRNGIASTLNLYEQGGHGFGIGRAGEDSAQWTAEFIAWLKTGGFLEAKPLNTIPTKENPS